MTRADTTFKVKLNVKWKWNVRNGKVIYVKEGSRFYILYGLKIWPKFCNGNLSLKEGGGSYLSVVPKGLNTFKLNRTIPKLNQK